MPETQTTLEPNFLAAAIPSGAVMPIATGMMASLRPASSALLWKPWISANDIRKNMPNTRA